MCDCDIHSNIHCTWLKHYSELLEVFNCVNCIKINLRKSNESVKHCDLYCENCDPNNKNHDDSDECSWYKYYRGLKKDWPPIERICKRSSQMVLTFPPGGIRVEASRSSMGDPPKKSDPWNIIRKYFFSSQISEPMISYRNQLSLYRLGSYLR